MNVSEKNVAAFNADVAKDGGYSYTSAAKLSARIANERISAAIHELASGMGRRIVDIGCGDGTYTSELLALNPEEVLGLDAADVAIERAHERMAGMPQFRFEARSVYDLSPYYGQFDIAIVRGVLHHLREPDKAIAEIVKTAPVVVVMEPNGFNPVLKVLEKVSTYHKEHEERSFFPFTLNRWFAQADAPVDKGLFVNTVPMFCPDWFASLCKSFGPLAERIPGVSHIGCGQYIFRARRPRK